MNKQLKQEDFDYFCKSHDCTFYRMGCPEDWNRKDVFRVGVVGGTAWASYVVTIETQQVEKWLSSMLPLIW